MESIKMIQVNKKKICFFLPSLNGGGAERVLLTLARAFPELGYSVDLVLFKMVGAYIPDIPPNINVISLETTFIFALPKFIKYLKNNKPSCVISTLAGPNLVSILGTKLLTFPISCIIREAANPVSSFRGLKIKHKFLFLLQRFLYPFADQIIAPSKGIAQGLIECFKLPESIIKVINNPIEIRLINKMAKESINHPWFSENQGPVIISMGRLVPQKDFPTLIKAFHLLRKHVPAKLLILGEGPERTNLEKLIFSLNLMTSVALPGFVENPFKYLNHAALFVLSSAWEGLPNALIQALACGTPIVATDCKSGPREILENGTFGFLVPVGNCKILSNAMLSSLKETPDTDSLKARALDFSAEKIARKYLDVVLHNYSK